MTAAGAGSAPRHVDKDECPRSETAQRFEEYLRGDPDVPFLLIDAPPGSGPGLHAHPYAEVFVIQEGEVTFTVGDA